MFSGQSRVPVTPAAVPVCIKVPPQPAGTRDAAQWLEPANPGENFFTSEEWQVLGQAFDFSKRELAVAILLVEGCSREEIGARLHKTDGSGLSTDTVRVYIDRIFFKGRTHDRLGLVLRLVRAHRELFGRA
jgi:DNA-binding NarL/FixJ family response regulator